jgi:hypothetical protein
MLNENEILKKAVEKTNLLTHLFVQAVPNMDNNSLFSGELEYLWENKKINLPIVIRKTLLPIHVDLFAEMKLHDNSDFILIAEYINPNLAQRLKSIGVFFIDTVGNVFINKSPILIDIKGEKMKTNEAKNRLYTTAGLQVLFSLLTIDDLINKPYREIAKISKSANGTVAIIMNNLKEHNFIINVGGKKFKFVDKQRVLENWTAFYSLKLKPKKIIGKFNSQLPDFWKKIDISKYNAQWSSEVAAVKRNYLFIPRNYAIYIENNLVEINKLKLEARLSEDKNGNIELVERFWNNPNNSLMEEIVDPLIVYVDLIGINDPRNFEIASLFSKEVIGEKTD